MFFRANGRPLTSRKTRPDPGLSTGICANHMFFKAAVLHFLVRTQLFQNVAPIFCYRASTHRDAHEHTPKHSQTHTNTDTRPSVHSHMHTWNLHLFLNFVVSFMFSTVRFAHTDTITYTHTPIYNIETKTHTQTRPARRQTGRQAQRETRSEICVLCSNFTLRTVDLHDSGMEHQQIAEM